MNKLQNVIPVLLGIVMAIVVHTIFLPQKVHSTPLIVPTSHVTPVPKEEFPSTITIPALNLQTAIDHVGLTSDKAMAEPIDEDHVGWYKLGVKPEEKGNAVIAAHYDDEDGPSVFYKLSELKNGDEIIITDNNGKKSTFVVKQKETYAVKNFPMQKVFGKSDKKMLNLITCAGAFDKKTKDYAERSVVYSELKE